MKKEEEKRKKSRRKKQDGNKDGINEMEPYILPLLARRKWTCEE
jgi:hypothetical protein